MTLILCKVVHEKCNRYTGPNVLAKKVIEIKPMSLIAESAPKRDSMFALTRFIFLLLSESALVDFSVKTFLEQIQNIRFDSLLRFGLILL